MECMVKNATTCRTRTNSAVAVSALMVGSLAAYVLTMLSPASPQVLSDVTLATLVVNVIGAVWLANLSENAPVATRFTGLFLGAYILVSATYGAFVSGIQTLPQLEVVGLLIVVGAFLGSRAIKQRLPIDTIAPFVLVALVTLYGIFGLATQHSEFQLYQRAYTASALVAALALIPFVRAKLARLFSMDSKSAIVATSFVFAAITFGFVANSYGILTSAQSSISTYLVTPTLVLGQLIVFILLAFLGVGWLTRRSLKSAAKRLGLTVPTWRMVLPIIGFAAALFAVNIVGAWLGLALHVSGAGSDDDVSRAMLANFHQIGWSVFLAASAGIGEEILFRGALQPRFGLIVTSLAFASLHIQYDWFGMVLVAMLGLTLGFERKKYGTTASILSHLLYDLIGLVLIFSK